MEFIAVGFDFFETDSLCAHFVELEMDFFVRFDEGSDNQSALNPNNFMGRDLTLAFELQYLHFF